MLVENTIDYKDTRYDILMAFCLFTIFDNRSFSVIQSHLDLHIYYTSGIRYLYKYIESNCLYYTPDRGLCLVVFEKLDLKLQKL